MSLIDSGHSSNNQTSKEYYQDELKNALVLLFEIDKAILTITKTNISSYKIETGQSSQSVTRADLPQLIEQRKNLLDSIRQLEMYLGEGQPAVKQVRPDW